MVDLAPMRICVAIAHATRDAVTVENSTRETPLDNGQIILGGALGFAALAFAADLSDADALDVLTKALAEVRANA